MRALAFLTSCAVVCVLGGCSSDFAPQQPVSSGSGGAGGKAAGGGAAGSDPSSATFTQVKVIFQASCGTGNCHLNGKSEGKLQLDGDVAYAHLVGTPATVAPGKMRVAAGDPGASFLMTKLYGNVAADGSEGAAMPLIVGSLEADQIAIVKVWIQSGAKDD